MFINCKKNLVVRVGDQIKRIEKDFIGEIPDELASHWMIRAAIKDGTIATPAGTSDKKLEQADEVAAGKAAAADIRPDGEPKADDQGTGAPYANQDNGGAGAEKAEAAEGEKKPKK